MTTPSQKAASCALQRNALWGFGKRLENGDLKDAFTALSELNGAAQDIAQKRNNMEKLGGMEEGIREAIQKEISPLIKTHLIPADSVRDAQSAERYASTVQDFLSLVTGIKGLAESGGTRGVFSVLSGKNSGDNYTSDADSRSKAEDFLKKISSDNNAQRMLNAFQTVHGKDERFGALIDVTEQIVQNAIQAFQSMRHGCSL